MVLDLQATPIMERRMARADSIEDQLFALMMLCVDWAGEGNNCIDHFFDEDQHRELLIP